MKGIHTKKLVDRSRAVNHLEKELGSKAYHLYDPKDGSLHVSRDVMFEVLGFGA